jgi:AcrR family transcriptional regulator
MTATTRTTRVERKAQTRSDLLTAARRVFLRSGFHGASLEEIAEEAGYTKGAVYSNFDDKAALYLAVLATHYEHRIGAYTDIMLESEDFYEAMAEVSRFMAEADAREPRWLPLVSEFVAHAALDEELRLAYVEIRSRFLEAIARLLDASQERYQEWFRITSYEVARASSLLMRAFSAERQTDPSMPADLFAEIHTAMLRGLIDPDREAGKR